MIDLRTLLILVAVADVMVAAILWIGAGRRMKQGAAMWIASLVARALASSIIAIGIEPRGGAFAIAGALLALSITLQADALLAHDAKRLPGWVHTAVMTGVAVPFALLTGDPVNIVLFGGLIFGTLLVVLAAIASQVRPAASGRASGRGILIAAFGMGAIAFYTRGVAVMFSADPLAAFVGPSAFQSATFVASAAAAIVSTFGFMLLHKERAEGEALRLATMDPLTGAYNRRTFHEIAERELSRARRAGQPLSIIVLDIDHFRPINEQYGNRAGDEVLRQIADLVRTALRKEDMLVRYGGEQLLVMLPDVPGPGAVVVAGRIRKSVEAEALGVAGQEVSVTVSVGVSARLDEGPESIEGLLARAEEALAIAKKRGRNRVVALSLGRSIAA
jgi:diguanylate cyclase (GGDEF)-like protein